VVTPSSSGGFGGGAGIVIAGGGIAGLSAAYQLAKAGVPSTIVEPRARLGGVIRTEHVQGCVIEAGPDSFLAAKPWALELIRDVGLGDQVIGSNDHQRVTFIVRRNRLVPLPDGLIMMAPTRIGPMVGTRLISWPAKIRMGFELLRKAPAAPLPERSVSAFVREHYGDEAVEYLAEPLLAGVYGGDPDQLSANAVLTRFVELETKYGSISRGLLEARRRRAAAASPPGKNGVGGGESLFQTLRGGLGALVDTLWERSRRYVTVIQGEVETAERGNAAAAGYRLRVGGEWMEARHVILATPAYAAGSVLRGLDGELAGLLESVPYNSSTTVSLGYDRATLRPEPRGFGFLVPQKERRRLVACTVVGNKFPYRVPEDKVVLRCFLKGSEGDSDGDLVATVRAELKRILSIEAEPVFQQVARWPRSMAQYTVGHAGRVAAIEERRRQLGGVYLAGNAYTGIGVPDCVRMGREAARAILAGGAAVQAER
jgi:protoporphyrinogen/coproporphyrinogen III oxidase